MVDALSHVDGLGGLDKQVAILLIIKHAYWTCFPKCFNFPLWLLVLLHYIFIFELKETSDVERVRFITTKLKSTSAISVR